VKILVYGVLLALFWVFAVAHPALASTPRVSLGAAESYSVLAPEETLTPTAIQWANRSAVTNDSIPTQTIANPSIITQNDRYSYLMSLVLGLALASALLAVVSFFASRKDKLTY